jgi:glucose/arabinose dehydrogenase
MSIKLSILVPLGLAVLVGIVPVAAQAPDCTGISDASDYDGPLVSDFNGKLTAVLVASGLLRPLFVTSPPGDVDRLFIVEQDGLIKILRDGAVLGTPFLDVAAISLSPADGGHNEEGLLGLAFHPDYDSNGWFFVYHTNSTGTQNVVARYTVSANPDVADTGSRVEVIAVNHPTHGDQDGGMLAFNSLDGYLYIGVGDGGGDCDPPDNAQSLTSNLGKLLRLNVDSLPPSTAGNPYDGAIPGNDEIWSFGLRNPWRFSFDRLNGVMLIGDVGESVWEELDCQPPTSVGGENYGWNRYEGGVCPAPSSTCPGTGNCIIASYVPPIRTYGRLEDGFSCAVVGGYVYRGCRMSDLHGTYFYTDFCSSNVHTFRVDAACVTAPPDLNRTSDLAGPGVITQVTSFGEDERGELYLIDRGTLEPPTGEVFRIVPTLGIMEVSGLNAPLLAAGANGDWIWEDLARTSGHPISSYKVYRSSSPAGTFVCAHQGAGNSWSGGDPSDPSISLPPVRSVPQRNASRSAASGAVSPVKPAGCRLIRVSDSCFGRVFCSILLCGKGS